jgi:hypothetical protein
LRRERSRSTTTREGNLVNARAPGRVFHVIMRIRCFTLVALLLVAAPARAADERVNVHVVADEAEAVLAILALRAHGREPSPDDWKRLFASEGYVRLAKREASMNRAFTDDELRSFVLSDDLLARAPKLAETLEAWKRKDPSAAARRALAYLPADATIRAKIYPVVKPRENSFVFETDTDPAIFLYLDPSTSAAKFENTLAHELHHIGFASVARPEPADLPAPVRRLLVWTSAFGEGLAMLAAAGGPDVHPHATSPAADRDRWDRDVAHFDDDLRKVEAFFVAVLDGKLDEEKERAAGFEFFGVQGPWYTVGWKMAVVIERAYGREAVVEAFTDGRCLLATYNRAATEHNRRSREKLALWSPDLLERLGAGACERKAGARTAAPEARAKY